MARNVPKNGHKRGGAGVGGGDGIKMNSTRKFAVLEYPGVTQPDFKVEKNGSAAVAKEGQQGRRATAGSGPKIEGTKLIGGDSWQGRQKNPGWLKERASILDKIKERRQAELQEKKLVPITVTLPDGKVLEKDKNDEQYMAWKATPLDVAISISQGLADKATVARVTYESFVEDYSAFEDGMEGADVMEEAMEDGDFGVSEESDSKTFLWDMGRPLVGPVAKIEFLKFGEDKDADTVFWHSSAHIMGEALENLYGCKLTIGPPLAAGFYYDSFMGSDVLREDDCRWNRRHSFLSLHFLTSSRLTCVFLCLVSGRR